jgi:hypothetical protein
MEFGVLFFMECRHLDYKLMVEHCFLDFFVGVMQDLWEGEKKAFGERRK